MSVKLQYNCKFCGRPGTVEYEHTGILTPDQVDHWLKFVACDPCARFQRKFTVSRHAFYTMASNWEAYAHYNPDKVEAAKSKTTAAFERILRKLCDEVEKRFHVAPLFETNLVTMAVGQPQLANEVIQLIIPKSRTFQHQSKGNP